MGFLVSALSFYYNTRLGESIAEVNNLPKCSVVNVAWGLILFEFCDIMRAWR